ncbi:MAG: SDR family NAD(P)-dependent oxidoreductase [Planctomycetota bacterium]|jgi:short-subunit dehydrogenase
MSKTALITGASAGIGHELSKIFAKNGYNLVLVSRNKQRLEDFANVMENQHDITAKVIPKDLSQSSAPQELYDATVSDGIDIDVLVNNAGFGLNGYFTDFEADEHMKLVQVNVTSLTLLCKLFGTDMVRRRSGSILNVASTAAFQAGPLMSSYYASKAYVLSLSEALNNEFARDGVKVSVLCPGPTDTEFADRADMNSAKIINVPWVMKAADVAEIGYSGLMKGKKIIIPGLMNKLLAYSVRLTPRSVLVLITRSLNQKK